MANVVIGAGSGMGAAVAGVLASRGRLIVVDRDLDAVTALSLELGGDVEPMRCDITDPRQVEAVVNAIGDLEALVLTAGISGSMGNGRRIFEVNLLGTASVLRAVDHLVGPGTVGVCFASMSAYRVPPRPELLSILDDPLANGFFEAFEAIGLDPDAPQLAYPASKRGVQQLVRRLCPSWGARGARIISVSPGINDTPMNHLDESKHPIMAEIIKSSPLGRRGRPEEVANVVEFLTSEKASFVTGSDVLVDGGMVAVLPDDTTGGRAQGTS